MRESREEEYIRRMRERGYTPTLAGMDDEDIEWELNKMDGMDPFGERRPAERLLNPRYKPADPAMVARIYRQMGRPYDASLIPERERHYLNGGWDDGDKDGYRAENPVRKMPYFGARSGVRTPDTLLPSFGPQQGGAKGLYWSIDPLAKGWRPGWGTEGGPADNVRTMEYQPGRDNDHVDFQLASDASNTRKFGSFEDGTQRADAISGNIYDKGAELGKEIVKLKKFGEKAYNIAKEQGYNHDEAMLIAQNAQWMYGSYRAADIGSNFIRGKLKWTGPAYVGKEVTKELYEDELQRSIIEKAMNDWKRPWLPPEASTLPP